MNNLTLFVYFADVTPRAGNFLTLLAIISGVALAAFVVISLAARIDDERGVVDSLKLPIKWLSPAFLIISLMAVFTPSKETLYLMAGSEVGETVVTSPEAQIILKDIHEVIRAQLNQLKVQS